jgi:hypothetical protein
MANSEFVLSPYRGSGGKIIAAVASVLFLGLALVFGHLIMSMGSGSFTWDGKELRADGAIYHEAVAAADLRLTDAKIVDLDNEQTLKLGSRKSGMKLSGYDEGWFHLGNGDKALVFVSGADHSKVLFIPTKKDFSLLISPTDPDAMLSALRQPPAQPVTYQINPPPASAKLTFALPLLVVLPVVIFFLLAARAPKRVKALLTDKSVQIQGLLSTHEIPYSEIDKKSIEVLNIGADNPRRPVRRTFGLGLPGLLLGWARLASGEKALTFLSDPSQVVYFKTSAGYSVLFSSPESQAMAAALRSR